MGFVSFHNAHSLLTGLADDDHTQYVLRSILTTDGDLFSRNAGAVVRIAAVASGSYLASAGTGTLPAWTTLNQAAVAGLTTASSPTFAGLGATPIITSSTGSHAVGGATDPEAQFVLRGTWTGTSTHAFGIRLSNTLVPPVGGLASGTYYGVTIQKAASGTHTDFTGLTVNPPTILAGGSTVTNATTVLVADGPSGGTNNYALWVAGGTTVLAGNVGVGTAAPTISGTGKLHMGANTFRLDTARTPASAGAAGNTGEICWDASFIYVCTATNAWERVGIASW